ncbi:DUF2510 domain-containing protein [Demequina sp.]|uniref:DUF2510 domain-containing protein n=1 Tax=Demequina sp. TaxID=2050685 RepID=UPI003A85D92B
MANAEPGWYDDGSGRERWWDGQTWTDSFRDKAPEGGGIAGMVSRAQADANAGAQPRPGAAGSAYVVLQVVLKEKMWGSGSNNLVELEGVINRQAALGYRLHTITTSSSGSQGFGGGDRIQATMVFERLA